jgi:predicted DNA-binding transcriptional regulator YafY
MSFAKAEQLLALATLVAARRTGVTIDEVIERFEVSKRTAQRMLRSLETVFWDTSIVIDAEGRKRWLLPSRSALEFVSLAPEELAALDLALETIRRSGLVVESASLLALREKIVSMVPRSKVARLETDHEALLEAQGLAARPGPKQVVDRQITQAIGEAIKACRIMKIEYKSRRDGEYRWRSVAPYGLLIGLRSYLIGRIEDDLLGAYRLYVVENIRSAQVTRSAFARDATFNLRDFANRSFGVFQNDEEHGEVVWRFSAEVADHASRFEFHPTQVLEKQADGSLLVKFTAAGHLEMCWHLYLWGRHVEVLAPELLRKMVEGYQRSDFPSLP